MPRRKARGISEIYTGHKRREGVVKVFRCTLLAWLLGESVRHTQAPTLLFFLPPPRMGVKFFEFSCVRGFDGRTWGVSSYPFCLPPFLRAIGRYHCQNGNGPIKILNRCYGRSFVVPYGGKKKREEGNDRGGRSYSSLCIRSLDRLLIPVRTNIA